MRHEEKLGVIDKFTIMTMVVLLLYKHMSKLFKLYTLNMFSLLYGDYTSINLLKIYLLFNNLNLILMTF